MVLISVLTFHFLKYLIKNLFEPQTEEDDDD